MTTITIDRSLLQQALDALTYQGTMGPTRRQRRAAAVAALRVALAAPATAPDEQIRNESKRKPMTDQDTLDLFNRIQLRMRFTDADARPFASGVASAEFFHGIKGTS